MVNFISNLYSNRNTSICHVAKSELYLKIGGSVYHDLATHLEMLSCLNTHTYMPYKQNGTVKILPPLVVPISGSAHGLLDIVLFYSAIKKICWNGFKIPKLSAVYH
jgi:hypothetical protein